MNNSVKHFVRFRRLAPAFAIALLTIQIALLWLQGSLLNRQYGEIASLRSDVQNLTVALHEIMATDEMEPFSFEKMKQSGIPGTNRIERIECSIPGLACEYDRTDVCGQASQAKPGIAVKASLGSFHFEKPGYSVSGFVCKSCFKKPSVGYLEK